MSLRSCFMRCIFVRQSRHCCAGKDNQTCHCPQTINREARSKRLKHSSQRACAAPASAPRATCEREKRRDCRTAECSKPPTQGSSKLLEKYMEYIVWPTRRHLLATLALVLQQQVGFSAVPHAGPCCSLTDIPPVRPRRREAVACLSGREATSAAACQLPCARECDQKKSHAIKAFFARA